MKNKHGLSIISIIIFCVSCGRSNYPIATYDDCTRVENLRINKTSRAVIDATLILKVDSRRRKYDPQEFCAYNQPTSNGKFYLLTIYDKIGNHVSPTWMLMSRSQVFDTQLNSYEMARDSARTNDKIIISINRLEGVDETSRRELMQMMKKDALDERK